MKLSKLVLLWLQSLFALVGFVLLSGCSGVVVNQSSEKNEALYQKNNLIVCHEFNCNHMSQVALTGTPWRAINRLFKVHAKTAQEERQTISKAIALMEQFTGRVLGTSNDKARNENAGEGGQMDCIDESTNTTTYLKFFEHKGWLKWHQVQERAYRSYFFFDIHWTAVIKDKQNQQFYAIDSWFRANGQAPVVLKLEDWKAKQETP